MPKMKRLSALVLVTGRASLFVEVKNLFSEQVTRYPALNSLKAVALPAVRRLISPTHLQKLLTSATAFFDLMVPAYPPANIRSNN